MLQWDFTAFITVATTRIGEFKYRDRITVVMIHETCYDNGSDRGPGTHTNNKLIHSIINNQIAH